MNHTVWLFLLCDQVYLHLWGIIGNFFFFFLSVVSHEGILAAHANREKLHLHTCSCQNFLLMLKFSSEHTDTHSHDWVFKRWQLFVFLHKSFFFITVSFILCDTCSPSNANLSIWHQTAPTVGCWSCYLLLSAVKVSVQQPRSEF